MAKRKRKKKEKESFFSQYKDRIIGIIILILSIAGIGNMGTSFGILGRFVKIISSFLFGEASFIVLLFTIVMSIYKIYFNDKLPKSSLRVIGSIILILNLTMLFEVNYIESVHTKFTLSSILDSNVNTLVANFKNFFAEKLVVNTGGGFLGGASFFILTNLLNFNFAKILVYVFLLLGLFFTILGISFVDSIKDKVTTKMDELKSKNKDKDDTDTKKLSIFNEERPELEETSSFYEIQSRKEKERALELEKTRPYELATIAEFEDKALDKLTRNSSNTNKEIKVELDDNTKELSKTLELNKRDNLNNYLLPDPNLVLNPVKASKVDRTDEIKADINKIETTLSNFDIEGKVIDIHAGPSVTQYELKVKAGTKLNKITGINRELALALSKKDLRIEAPIPGKDTVGIEVANSVSEAVSFKDCYDNMPQKLKDSKLAVVLGKDVLGNYQYSQINKTPHLLIAGATGSGKSVCINAIIMSILMNSKPNEVKLVLIDPKKVELTDYNNISHLLWPVITDAKEASIALKYLVEIMEDRFKIFEEAHAKNIEIYNKNKSTNRMPYIVCIIDELADLMLVASKDVENSIMRITQMARAAGIHLIVATQRPSTDIITGVVKSNIPSRISFAVSSSIDSRTILDQSGAEKLLGKGDMLYKPMGANSPIRIQGVFVEDNEILNMVNYIKSQGAATFDSKYYDEDNNEFIKDDSNSSGSFSSSSDSGYSLYDEVLNYAIEQGEISTSKIQRRFKIGYNKAADIMDQMEVNGVVGSQNGSKPRKVLIKKD